MGKSYESYEPNDDGSIDFSPEENRIWERLYLRQIEVVEGRACEEFLAGIDKLRLPFNKIPFPYEVSKDLKRITGWVAEPVPAVIGPKKFFSLLSEKKFPAACFIRSAEDFDYIKEPDIFHEIFGHLPLLTNQIYANFIEEFGKFALTCDKSDHKFLFRLFWFTVEFGLIKTPDGDRIYGGGILSSFKETQDSLNNPNIQYEDYDLLKILRTPFRIDVVQKLYFRVDSFEQMFSSLQGDLKAAIAEARELGDVDPLFKIVDGEGDQLEYTN